MIINTFRLNYLNDENVYNTYKIDVVLLTLTMILVAADILFNVAN